MRPCRLCYNVATMNGWRAIGKTKGFTIVELIVVIVVIAILAVLVVAGYDAVISNARESSVKSDLQKIDDAFKQYALDHEGVYPKTFSELSSLNLKLNDDSYEMGNRANIYLCLNPTSTEYAVVSMALSKKRFVMKSESGLSEYSGSVVWNATTGNWNETCQDIDSTYTSPSQITGIVSTDWQTWTGVEGATCPTNFVKVPGNSTLGTFDFCVMKYEAKDVAGVPTSQASGTPWVSITQASAKTASLSSCTGCHLITDAQWLTLAYDIASVAENWTGAEVGSGSLYTGHNDNAPAAVLAANVDDAQGYSSTGDTFGAQKRTMTLSNGQVIWDVSGNASELVDGIITSGQHPGTPADTGVSWRDWSEVGMTTHGMPASTNPTTTISGATEWTFSQGIGMVNSYYGDTASKVIIRGGSYATLNHAGIFSLNLGFAPTYSNVTVGFRVAR